MGFIIFDQLFVYRHASDSNTEELPGSYTWLETENTELWLVETGSLDWILSCDWSDWTTMKRLLIVSLSLVTLVSCTRDRTCCKYSCGQVQSTYPLWFWFWLSCVRMVESVLPGVEMSTVVFSETRQACSAAGVQSALLVMTGDNTYLWLVNTLRSLIWLVNTMHSLIWLVNTMHPLIWLVNTMHSLIWLVNIILLFQQEEQDWWQHSPVSCQIIW